MYWRVSMLLMSASLVFGCTERRDISGVAPYSDMIGRTYKIVGAVNGLGVKPLKSNVPPEYVHLEPLVRGYSGPEIAFTRLVPNGRTFRIVSAWIFDTPIDDQIYYVVEFDERDTFDPHLPVRLGLDGGNEAGEGRLNPQYYERVK